MKSLTPVSAIILFFILLSLSSCTKNETRLYEDSDNSGLSIFSNRGNNVMACFINGEAWQTRPRLTTTTIIFGSNTHYEIDVYRNPVTSTTESIQVNWQGHYQKDPSALGYVSLQLTIPRNSFQRYLTGLQGQRIRIDSSAGSYFTASTGQPTVDNKKANGTIYFQTVQIDSIASGVYSGKMAGIFEANFGSGTITKGRFDHILTQAQIR